jgi:hypothetical protein
MVHSLRNRNLAAETLKTATPAAMVADMTPEQIKYWTGFAEWFADNVSRWATTADKPLTITEKFFARIAQMMRDLVAIVTGRKYPPNKKVAAFLESMGPGSSNAWFGVITPPTAGQGIAPLQTAPDNPKFNKWFGKSKVVNAAGSPLVLYHGTSNDIEDGVFRPSKYGSLGEGVYFTSDPEAASKFAMGVRGSNKTPKAQGNVVPAYLRIEMPFDDEFFVGNTDWQNWAATVLRRGSQYEYEMRSWGGPSEFEEAKKLLAKLNSGTATLRDILFVHGDAEAPWGREILKQVKAHGAFDGVILKDSPKGFDEYVVFNPNQVKSAIGNRGTYSLTSPKIEDALAFNKTTPNGQAVLASLGITNPQQAYGTKAMYYGMANSSDVSAIDKVRTKVADSAASIDKRIMNYFNGAVRNSLGELNPMGLYRQAQDYSKMLLSFFKAGSIEKDASTGLWEVKDKGTTPPAKVLELVQQYADTSRMTLEEGMAAAGRALEAFRMQNLLQQDPQFPNHLTQGELNAGLALYNSDPIFAAMNAAMDASRKELVDHLVAVGRLSPDEGDDWKNVIGYVPFDRIEDFAKNYQKTKRTGSRAPLSVTKLPKLIGSQIRPVGNVFENYLNTMGWMVGQVMNTDARNQTLKFLESIKKAKFLGADTDGRPNIAYGYQDGGLVYWELPSEYDALAFKAETQTTGNWLRYLSEASNILRTSVTALPPFALKQVVDDIQRALLTSGVQNPLSLIGMVLTNFPKIALAEIRGVRHRIVEEAEALGLSGEYDFKAGRPGATFMEDMGYRPRGMFRTILHRLDGITRASDLAVRRAIYDQTMKESNDKLLAQTRAREFINFRRRGSSDFVGVMVKTIPFFNAYVQGMDVLYRSASGIDSGASINRAAARKMFWSRAGIAIALSTVYAMGKDDDDEEYNEADLRTRDGNWFVGGTKLSVPGELGALFKVIPERVVEYYKRKGTPEEQEAMEAVRTALSYMFEQYVGRVTPVPQAVKPLLEAWTNYSFLTGRELIGIHQKNLDPSMQVREGTSELAIAIANFARDMVGVDKISPIIVDNVLRGYLGSTAAMTVMVTDGLLNPTRIDRPLHKYALLSNYMIDPVGKRRIAEFYDERDNVGRANATLNEMVARGDLAGAEAYMQKHEQVLMLNTSINATLEQLEQTRAYRKYLNSPESAATMSMEERMEMRTEVEKMERELVGWLREAKTMIRKDAG